MKQKVTTGFHLEIQPLELIHWRLSVKITDEEWNRECMRNDAKEMKEYVETLKDVSASIVEDFYIRCSYCHDENYAEDFMYSKKRHEKVPGCCSRAFLEWCDASFRDDFGERLNFIFKPIIVMTVG